MTAFSDSFKRFGRTFLVWFALIVCIGLLVLSLILKLQQNSDSSPDIIGKKEVAKASKDAPRQSEEKQVADLDNPTTDGWQSEAVADQVKHQLEGLLKLATGSQRAEQKEYDKFVAPQYSGQRIVPVGLQSIYKDGFVEIKRPNALPAAASITTTEDADVDRQGFIASLIEWGASVGDAEGLHFEIKVIRVHQNGHQAKTKQKIAVTGQAKNGGYEQHAVWSCTFNRDAEDKSWKLLRLAVLDFEVASSSHQQPSLFVDGTASVLDQDACFESQILRSYNTHLKRMQDWRYSARIGWTGLAVADVNGDGREDLYVTQDSGLPNLLLIQQEDGTVRNVADQWGVDWLHDSPAALFLDFDNDRDQDLAVAIESGIVLCANQGDRFEVKKVLPISDDVKSLSAADFNLDGKVDLFCCVYDRNAGMGESETVAGSSPLNEVFYDAKSGGPNLLFQNRGDWDFVDVTQQVGLNQDNVRLSYASAWEDYDNDGDPDLYIANDFAENQLFRNDFNPAASKKNNELPQFVDVAQQVGAQDQAGGMSVSWSDHNRDGWMDLYIGNMFSSAGNRVTTQEQFKAGQVDGVRGIFTRFSRGNSLLVNRGDGGFDDAGGETGVSMGRWAWSSCFADVNNDGWQDILIGNGFITGENRQQDL